MDSLAEETFDRLTRLVTNVLHVPVALVSLVAGDRQFFKSCVGLPEPWATARQTPLTHSFCQHVVNSQEALIVADAGKHPLVKDNQAVRDLAVVAYAGVPLVTPDGFVLGSLCAIDNKPRAWTDREVGILHDLAASVMAEVALLAAARTAQQQKEEQRSVRDALARDALLLVNVRDSVIVTDLEGVVTFWNEGATRLFGFTADEMVGRPYAERLPEPSRREVSEWIGRIAAGEAEFEGEWLDSRKDGSRVWIEANTRRITDPAGNTLGIMGVSHDITERKRAEEALRRQTRSLRLLADTSVRLLTDDDPTGLMETLFRQLGDHLGLEVFFNFLVTEDGRRLRLAACGGIDDGLRASLQYLNFGQAVCGTVAAERTPMAIEDVQSSADPRADLVRSLGVTAYACHPLLAHGRLIGTLSYGSRTRTRFAPDELDLMRAASDQVAMALDRKRLTDELRQRADDLARANAAKDRLFAVLSHELRNPLSPVLMSATMMEADPALPPEFLSDVQMIRRNVELEVRLIDDLLDLTRVTHGKLELHTEVVDVHTLLSRTFEMCQSDMHDKGLRLELDLGAGRHHAQADPARLQQVMWNVVKNAIKFTPQAGRVAVGTNNVQGGSLQIDVTDTGTGIEPANLSKIFNAFEQESSVTRRFGGLGLGLSISKALVEMHGGTIVAKSEGKGRGATFSITLPTTEKVKELGPAAVRSAGPQTSAGRPCLKILLVEDDESTVRAMTRLLRGMCHEVTSAGTVAAAVERAAAERFDLLICDMGLPDGSGLDVMRQVKPNYPIKGIALTGYGMEDDIRQSREAGFDDHLIKPVTLDKLDGVIRELVR